ncbi:M15 family metallopeptidase [Priestia aryabhattai]|uniref:M15 family metallopeptidase n=1 Tax=Priestia aryabhattai TaxID=412384 RepID=UPI0005EC0AA6|nr:M15 family metallopeptidase [Priestia aryabhattai]KJL04953.1 peptidase M15 [Priestia aryabhattai B8W22]
MNVRKKLAIALIVAIAVSLLFLFRDELKPGPTLKDFSGATELHPVVEEKKNKLVQQANDQGISIVITEGFRSKEEQDKLYAKGRTEEGNIVTYSKGGQSYHNYGLAIDFAIRLKDGRVVWDMEYDGNHNNQSDWMEVVDIAKGLEFEWGGDWQGFKDYPHFQMNPENIKDHTR